MSKTKKEIQNLLSKGPRIDLSKNFSRASGVALIFSGSNSDLDLLFIKRALNPTDRWSGQIAFPGGKKEEADPTLLAACIREVHEEIGITLSDSQLLGSIDDIQARKRGNLLDFYIEPFVFYVDKKPELHLSPSEVNSAYWMSLEHLASPANATTFEITVENTTIKMPAVRFPNDEVLWGLSHMMLQNLFEKISRKN